MSIEINILIFSIIFSIFLIFLYFLNLSFLQKSIINTKHLISPNIFTQIFLKYFSKNYKKIRFFPYLMCRASGWGWSPRVHMRRLSYPVIFSDDGWFWWSPMADLITGSWSSPQGNLDGPFTSWKESPEKPQMGSCRSWLRRGSIFRLTPKTPWNLYQMLPNSP